MKYFITLLLSAATLLASAQVTKVNYRLDFNAETEIYTCNLVIVEGTATTFIQRLQASSLVTLVIPTGTTIDIFESHNPLKANGAPADWSIFSIVQAPSVNPSIDLLGVVPALSPTATYSEPTPSDVIPLYSFTAIGNDNCTEKVRLFENKFDPKPNDPGLGGANFSNGFSMGSPDQLYERNETDSGNESCLTLCVGMDHQLETLETGTWLSSNKSVLTVSETGLLSPVVPFPEVTVSFTDADECVKELLYYEILSASDPQCLTSTTERLLSEVRIFPNPVSDILHIENLNSQDKIDIYDMTGRIVYQVSDLYATDHDINTQLWVPGAYRIKVSGINNSMSTIIVGNK